MISLRVAMQAIVAGWSFRWSSGFSLGRLAVAVFEGYSHTVAIGLLTRQERRLKPELQQAG
jgi:hypothetical protein